MIKGNSKILENSKLFEAIQEFCEEHPNCTLLFYAHAGEEKDDRGIHINRVFAGATENDEPNKILEAAQACLKYLESGSLNNLK